MTLFITRPTPDGERTAQLIREAGIEAQAVPLMAVRQIQTELPTIPENAVLAFTSANGVRAWHKAGGPQRPVFTVGAATAETATELGLTVEGIASGDVEGLLILLETQLRGQSVLHVRGRHAIGALVERLNKAGHIATALELYEAKAVTKLPPILAEAIGEGQHDIGFFSQRTMRLFLELTKAAGLYRELSSIRAFCLSQAVAEPGVSVGFQSLHVTERPDLAGFVDSLRLQGT